jgi:hypothetical protein
MWAPEHCRAANRITLRYPSDLTDGARLCALGRARRAAGADRGLAHSLCGNLEQHLDTLAVAARLLENFGASECSGGIASVFVDAARDFALRRLWAAFGLQRARTTIIGPCAIKDGLASVDPACRMQELTLRAHIDIAFLVECEVLSAQ